MVKQRQNTQSRKTINQRKRRRDAQNNVNALSVPMKVPQMMFPGRDPSTPGVAFVRSVVVLTIGQQNYGLSFTGFNPWFTYARQILTPYQYFRVKHLEVQVLPTGGAASTTSTAFNVTNSVYIDAGAANILNDDYCAIANGITRPVLSPPDQYWRVGTRSWYSCVDQSGTPAAPPAEEITNGSINLDTSGVGVAGTAVGYFTVCMVMEFHTLK